ncbi:hypothetical protein PU088_000111 [Citrobacter farmeri]|uniref:DUF1482 domain-containing protein n=1 Tax=Citrobacter amalonaticus Y19 TaxID=1261127 RepID=A0A0F6TVY7_CITAM|nr:hypothetical protein [Citrobacter amalonaticus]AKE59674.1 hypothetical protein F384_14465 [Citrobacter amalonaticus Y19]EKV5652711.1 hypothetical protein [Citrobacter farmeri]
MYVLALVFALSGNNTKSEVIGAFTDYSQCEAASQAHSSKTKCYFLDPQKGMQEVNVSDTPHSN